MIFAQLCSNEEELDQLKHSNKIPDREAGTMAASLNSIKLDRATLTPDELSSQQEEITSFEFKAKFQSASKQMDSKCMSLETGISEIHGDLKTMKAQALKFDQDLEALNRIIVISHGTGIKIRVRKEQIYDKFIINLKVMYLKYMGHLPKTI